MPTLNGTATIASTSSLVGVGKATRPATASIAALSSAVAAANAADLPSYPSGIELEIYKSPYKLAGNIRVEVKLDTPLMTANFTDPFSGSALDADLWSSFIPTGGSISVSGGTVTLTSANSNAFPTIESKPGKTFPLDASIPWTLAWTQRFP